MCTVFLQDYTTLEFPCLNIRNSLHMENKQAGQVSALTILLAYAGRFGHEHTFKQVNTVHSGFQVITDHCGTGLWEYCATFLCVRFGFYGQLIQPAESSSKASLYHFGCRCRNHMLTWSARQKHTLFNYHGVGLGLAQPSLWCIPVCVQRELSLMGKCAECTSHLAS